MISVYFDLVKDAMFPKKHGVLTKRNKYLKVSGIPEMDAKSIKELRLKLRLSIGLFAELFGVSEKTVAAWENGTNVPSGPSLRLMEMLKRYPDVLVETRTVYETGAR